jgi:hypothetical protein
MAILAVINLAIFLFWLTIRPEGSHTMPWHFWVPVLVLDVVGLVGEFAKPRPSPFGIFLGVFGLLGMLFYFAPYLQ